MTRAVTHTVVTMHNLRHICSVEVDHFIRGTIVVLLSCELREWLFALTLYPFLMHSTDLYLRASPRSISKKCALVEPQFTGLDVGDTL